MPYVFWQTDLPKLDIQVDRGVNFEAWKAQWTSYSTLSGLVNEWAQTKVQVLCLSQENLTVVNNLGLTEEQKQDATAITTALKRHINGQINECVERHNLRSRTQQPGESFDNFLIALCELVKMCNFCSEQCIQKTYETRSSRGYQMQTLLSTFLNNQTWHLKLPLPYAEHRKQPRNCREMSDHIFGAILAVRQPRQQPAAHFN